MATAKKKTTTKKTTFDTGGIKKVNGVTQVGYGGDVSAPQVTADQVSLDPFQTTDTTFKYDPVTGKKVTADQISSTDISAGSVKAGTLADRFMTAADYSIVDPTQIASEFGDINRTQTQKNAELASKLSLDALNSELQGLLNYTPAASALKRGEIAKDNTFNQAQRDAQLAAGDSNLRADLMAQRDRANSFANGGLPSSINDRALELGVRSRSADMAASGGFGINSSAAKKAAELMSASQRVELSKYGDQLLGTNITARAANLLAPTQYSKAGEEIKVTPTTSVADSIAKATTDLNTGNITADKALTSLAQQSQFKSNLEQEAGKTNLLVGAQKDVDQAKLNLQADTTNVTSQLEAAKSNQLASLQAATANQSANLNASQFNATSAQRAEEVNANNAIETQKAAMTIQSQERQFKSNLELNLKTSNADRAFNAANVNAGRTLEAAVSNRNTRLEVAKTNASFIQQDTLARMQEAGANSRAAMAANASKAAAAMSYNANKDSINASIYMQQAGFNFQLAQQKAATDAFNKAADRKRASDNINAGLKIITEAPSIIDGVSKTVSAIGSIYDSITSTASGVPSLDSIAQSAVAGAGQFTPINGPG